MKSSQTKATGWRKVAASVWGSPNDPQIYGDLEIDASRLLAFIEEARRQTGAHVTVTHPVGKALARALAEHPDLNTRLFAGVHPAGVGRHLLRRLGRRRPGPLRDEGGGRRPQVVVEIAEELGSRVERVRTGDREVGEDEGPRRDADLVARPAAARHLAHRRQERRPQAVRAAASGVRQRDGQLGGDVRRPPGLRAPVAAVPRADPRTRLRGTTSRSLSTARSWRGRC